MFRGWDNTAPKNPFSDDGDDNDDAESPPQQNNNGMNNQYDAAAPPPPPPLPDDTGMFRDWERAAARYEETTAEIITDEDPLASPGASSLNGSLSGWSINAGMVDRESIARPFDVEDADNSSDDDGDGEEDEIEKLRRTSSPRQGTFKSHGLSMVKEEEAGEHTNDTTTTSPGNNMFDDVDLEAFPNNKHLQTSSSNGNTITGFGNNGIHGKGSSSGGGNTNKRDGRSSIANRIVHEYHTNPNLKFKITVGISMAILASCLLAVIIATASPKGPDPYDKLTEDTLRDFGLDLQSVYAATADPLAEPSAEPTTKSPSASPSVKPTSKSPSLSPVEMPTFNPTSLPTTNQVFIASSPSIHPTPAGTTPNPSVGSTTVTPTYSPSRSPITPSPTRDCTDEMGSFLTYNDKLRDCTWLDNGYNGATSTRKDDNCLGTALGDACKYTCRLYNNCMDYLLSSLSDFSNENDVSIGDVCENKEGLFMSNGSVPRECVWLDDTVDGADTPMKKNLNCGTPHVQRTELGIMCPKSCAGYNNCRVDNNGKNSVVAVVAKVSPHPGFSIGANKDEEDHSYVLDDLDTEDPTSFPTYMDESSAGRTDPPTTFEERCANSDGEFRTHMGTFRSCRWFNRDDIEEKKRLNCGITEIGRKCMESCPCELPSMSVATEDVNATSGSPTSSPTAPTQSPSYVPTYEPTLEEERPVTKGVFDEMEQILTLDVLADVSVEERVPDSYFGDSKRLNVAHDPDVAGRRKQSLLLFDLGFAAKSFGDVIGLATLSLYSVTGSEWGGVALKKMSNVSWSEESSVTWGTLPGGDGADEPTVSYVDTLDSNTWYDIDVTAAVQSALTNNEQFLGIRIVPQSDDMVDVYFASKERVQEPPSLVIDSRTGEPTPSPSYSPSYYPTATPTIELDCMDKKGTFTTHRDEEQPCSWLNTANGELKKDNNCHDGQEALMFCQATCAEYNGCDDMTCEDMSGTYQTHTGWTAECSWLLTGQGSLKLEQNCGTDDYLITEIGKRCQATCADYNGCAAD